VALFVGVELRQGVHAMVPLSMFRSASFSGLTAFTFLLYAAFNILFVLLPFLLMKGVGYSGLQAGLVFIPLQIVMTFGSPFIAGAAAYIGWRALLALGSVFTALAFVAALRLDLSGPYWTGVMPVVTLMAIGMCCVAAPLSTLVLIQVDKHQTGVASGLNSTVSRLGGLITTALMGMLLADHGARLASRFEEAMIGGIALCVLAACAALFIDGKSR
jgi:predicted MFS family arabinose efflux permease